LIGEPPHRNPATAQGLMEIEAARIEEYLLVVADPSKRGRSYKLSAIYRQYIGGLSAMPGDEE